MQKKYEFIFYFYLIISSLTLTGKCDKPGVRILDNIEYRFYAEPKKAYDKALEFCKKEGGTTAQPKTPDVINLFKDYWSETKPKDGINIYASSSWIGLKAFKSDYHLNPYEGQGLWAWEDGDHLFDNHLNKNWLPGAPDLLDRQLCTAMVYSKSTPGFFGKWDNKFCSTRHSFICQFEVIPEKAECGLFENTILPGTIAVFVMLIFLQLWYRKRKLQNIGKKSTNKSANSKKDPKKGIKKKGDEINKNKSKTGSKHGTKSDASSDRSKKKKKPKKNLKKKT